MLRFVGIGRCSSEYVCKPVWIALAHFALTVMCCKFYISQFYWLFSFAFLFQYLSPIISAVCLYDCFCSTCMLSIIILPPPFFLSSDVWWMFIFDFCWLLLFSAEASLAPDTMCMGSNRFPTGSLYFLPLPPNDFLSYIPICSACRLTHFRSSEKYIYW